MFIKIRFIFLILPFVFASMPFQSCASLEEFVNIRDVFKGNTQRDSQNYTLEEKSEYRKHNYLLKVKQKEEEKEILKRLEQDKKKKSSKKKWQHK